MGSWWTDADYEEREAAYIRDQFGKYPAVNKFFTIWRSCDVWHLLGPRNGCEAKEYPVAKVKPISSAEELPKTSPRLLGCCSCAGTIC
jgi:hypothetical protein